MATPERPVSTQTNGSKLPNAQRKRGGLNSKTETLVATDKFAVGYDFMLVNSGMDHPLFSEIIGCTSKHKKHDKLVLTLVTLGGSANEAYRIGRYLQSVYNEVACFIPGPCKSAGTLLALSANELRISPFGELGPLDVQLIQKDEILGRRSGLTTKSALSELHSHTFKIFETFMLQTITGAGGAVSFRLAADIAAQTAASVMSKIYEQITPDSIGQDFRDLSVATHYCERLNSKACNISPYGIARLVNEYPSHDFVIDLQEAKEIFEKVDLPTKTLYDIMRRSPRDCMRPSESLIVRMLSAEGKGLEDETVAQRELPRGKSDGNAGPRPKGGDSGGVAAEAQ